MDNTPTPTATPTSRNTLATRLALPIAAAALLVSGCNLEVDFNEESVRQSFDVETFESISIEAPFEVTIRQGATQSVDVVVGESAVDDLSVEVVDGELRVDLDQHSFNIGRDLEATITVVDLQSLHASSASDVAVVGLDVDALALEVDMASHVSVSGTIETLDLDMSQASDGDFHGTTIEIVTLEMSGASSADFPRTVDTISGSIRSASSLDVDADTTVSVDTSGAASIDRN